jgi:catechol 2,3-dioxygenase-like lactoylglutathione lyase family enzyme
MVRFHHVNLGVPTGGLDAEASFLVDVLGLRHLDSSEFPGARWFEDEDGKQVHLSEDPDHQPAARAHVAVEIGSGLAALEGRLEERGYRFTPIELSGNRTVLCRDPAGNRWELRGASVTA